ncbi:MAG: hypothetical protein ACLR7Z_05410 [Bilophila wadsworthia]
MPALGIGSGICALNGGRGFTALIAALLVAWLLLSAAQNGWAVSPATFSVASSADGVPFWLPVACGKDTRKAAFQLVPFNTGLEPCF